MADALRISGSVQHISFDFILGLSAIGYHFVYYIILFGCYIYDIPYSEFRLRDAFHLVRSGYSDDNGILWNGSYCL